MKLSFLARFFLGSFFCLFILGYWELKSLTPFLFTAHFFFLFLYFKFEVVIDSTTNYIFLLILYFIIQSFIVDSTLLSLLQSILLPILYFLFILLISSFKSVSLTTLKKFILILLVILPFFIISFETGGHGRLYGLFRNANITSYSSVLLLPIILIHPKNKIKFIGLFLILLILFFMQSRGPTLAVILGFFVYLFVNNNIARLRFLHYLIILSIVILVSSNIVYLFDTYTPTTFADYENDYHLLNGGYNGRDILWDIFLNRWKRSPFFGVGFENDKVFLYGKDYGVHNSYIDILMKTGIIGSTIVLLFFMKILKNIVNTKNKIFLPSIICSLAIVLSLSTNTSLIFVFNYFFFYFLFIYSLINLKIVK